MQRRTSKKHTLTDTYRYILTVLDESEMHSGFQNHNPKVRTCRPILRLNSLDLKQHLL